MKKHGLLLPAALCAAAIGFVLRLVQLQATVQSGGLPEGGGWIILAVCSVAVAAFAVLSVRKIPEESMFSKLYQSNLLTTSLSVLAAGLILAANVYPLLAGSGIAPSELLFVRINSILGITAALSVVASAAALRKGAKPGAWTTLVPTLFLLVNLVLNFRRWSVDPIALDYCYKLFFSIASMLGVYYCGGFLFDKGKRRVSAAWCLLGVYFGGVTLADGGLQHCLLTGGLMLLLMANAAQLLRAE